MSEPDALLLLFQTHLDAWLSAPLAELPLRLSHPSAELTQALDARGADLPALAPALAAHLVRRLQRKNQFAAPAERPLTTALEGWLKALAAAEPGARAEVLSGLPQWLSPMLQDLGSKETVSHEYSPALQLKVLGLEEKSLLPPLLDVGCGSRASLVHHLRDAGLDASGIDRDVSSDVALKADWLGYAYGEKRWGTVVSHLGFSLHFLNRHLSGSAEAERYAHVYMAVLRALKVGGVFAYAPALPFIEAHLPPALFKVTSVPLPKELRTEVLEKQKEAFGLDLGAATQVKRVS